MLEELNDNLNEIAPKLAGIPKKEQFVAPENYFEDFPKKVIDHLNSGKILFSLDRKENIDIPEQYFEHLSQNVIRKIQNTDNSTKVFPIRRNILRWSVAAAIVVTLSAISYNYFSTSNNTTPITAEHNFTTEDYTNYLMDVVTQEELVAFMGEEEFVESNENEALIDYILDNNDDLDLENL